MTNAYFPNQVTRISIPSTDLTLELLDGNKFGALVFSKLQDSNSQKWRVKNLEEKGGSGEFVFESVAVPGSYIAAATLALGAPLYGSPSPTIWVPVTAQSGTYNFVTADSQYILSYSRASGAVELAPTVLRIYVAPKATSSATLHTEHGDLLGYGADGPTGLVLEPVHE